jgi:hypothetical protein
MQNFTKFMNLWNFTFIQKWLMQKMWNIGAIISITNNKLQNFHSKIPFYEKMFYGKKTSKDSSI